jgi:hypothetical protein
MLNRHVGVRGVRAKDQMLPYPKTFKDDFTDAFYKAVG